MSLSSNNKVRLIAFYLPQFHPIPENDEWWGKGFTEWTNVAKAEPMFPGHYQPHIPADLGFYDLRLPEIRQAQADLAKEYGIYGFCYYHYWFNGKRLLERPFNEVLASGEPDFPFCLCWANENWTRAWDGLDRHILIEQKYGPEDDRQHIRWLANAFRDRRYIRIDDKPLFLVYRISKFPNPLHTANIWREEAQKMGLGDLYLCTVESLSDDRVDPLSLGFDAAVEFQPDWLDLPSSVQRMTQDNRIYDYGAMVKQMLRRDPPAHKGFPCVTPGWDNTARRRHSAVIFKDSTPKLYQQWLEIVIDKFTPYSPEENFVFINAWNEWSEGAHLEPCQKWGRTYLEATRSALQNSQPQAALSTQGLTQPVSPDTAYISVSVCIPTYNGARYLGEAITSVLQQTWTDFELIIVDDCSKDDTEAVVKSFQDKRLKFFKNSTRLGLVGNWNKCLELARGKYICVFHQDDVMQPKNLAQKVTILEENPSVGLVHSNVYQIGPAGEVLSEWWYFKPDPNEGIVQNGWTAFEKLFWGVNIVCCPSVVIRRECYEKLGGFDPHLPFTADWEMWLRLALFYDVAYLPEGLVKYRRHNHNETRHFSGAKELDHAYLAKLRVLEKYPAKIPDVQSYQVKLAQWYKRQGLIQAVDHYDRQEYNEAKQYLAFALQFVDNSFANTLSDGNLVWLFEIIEAFHKQKSNNSAPASLLTQVPVDIPELSLLYRPVKQQMNYSLSGEEIARRIPIRRIIQAIAFKVANQPGLGWLYRFRDLGKRIISG